MAEPERQKAIEKAKNKLYRNGVKFRDEPNKPKVVWGAIDCLKNYGKFLVVRNGETAD